MAIMFVEAEENVEEEECRPERHSNLKEKQHGSMKRL